MKKQLTAALVALTMLAVSTILTSCGEKKPELSRVSNVYKSTDIPIDEDISIQSMFPSADGIIALAYIRSETNPKPVILKLDAQSGEYTTEDITLPENSYVSSISAAPDGSEMLLAQSYDEKTERQSFELYKLADGKCELYAEDLASFFPKTDASDDIYFYFYINGFALDGDGNIYLASDDTLIALDSSMKKLYELDLNGRIDTLAADSQGRVFAKYRDDNWNMNVAYLDNAKRGFGTPLVLPDNNEFRNSEIYIGPGYDFYIDTDTALYGHNSGDAAPTELCNWINSDIIHGGVQEIVVIDSETMVVYYYEYDYETETSTSDLYLLKHIPDEEVTEKYIIDIAVYSTPYQLSEMAVRYNRSSDKYRVRITDWSVYSTEEDYLAGQTKLENEMLAGNSPDMIVYSDFPNANAWAKNNSFADLSRFLDSDDGKLKREDFFDGMLEQLERNGKLYELPSVISLETLIGKTENLPGERWKVSELVEFASGLDEDTWLMRNMNTLAILNNLLTVSLDSFIDYDGAICSFDTPEFKALLEYVKTAGAKGNLRDALSGDALSDYENDRNSVLRNDTVLLESAYVNDVAGFLADKYGFGDADVTPIGYPTDSGSGAIMSINESYAIFKSSPVKEGAWEFICSIFEAVNTRYMHSIPAVERVFDKLASEELTRQYFFDADGSGWSSWTVESDEEAEERLEAYKDRDGVLARVTQADIDEVASMVRGAKLVGRGIEREVFALISEEAQLYFDGSKSLDETAKVIQDRVSLLVAENS